MLVQAFKVTASCWVFLTGGLVRDHPLEAILHLLVVTVAPLGSVYWLSPVFYVQIWLTNFIPRKMNLLLSAVSSKWLKILHLVSATCIDKWSKRRCLCESIISTFITVFIRGALSQHGSFREALCIKVANKKRLAKPKSGAPKLLFNSISAYGFSMNVITLQIPHPFWICSKLFRDNNNYNVNCYTGEQGIGLNPKQPFQ